jgi:hypothetical protein
MKCRINNYFKIATLLLLVMQINNTVIAQDKKEVPSKRIAITIGTALGFQYYNTLQQSSESGTPIALGKYSTSKPLALRLQVDYYLSNTKKIRVLLSPFNETGVFTPTTTTNIEGKQFATGVPIKTRFGFNVLRVGFSNKQEEGRFKNFKIGGTLAIRKWQASFKSANNNTANDNIIAVPLLFVGYEKFITPKLFFNTEIDGLIVPFASVMEGGSSLNYTITKNISAGLQYRVLAGTYNASDVKNKFITQNIGLNACVQF